MNTSAGGRLQWEISIPLVTNRYILATTAWVVAGAYLMLLLIVGTVLVGVGEAADLIPLAWVTALVAAGIWLLMALTMLVVFGNRWHARFAVDRIGITCETLGRRPQRAGRIGATVGAAAVSPTVAGAGLLALSRRRVTVPWGTVRRAAPAGRDRIRLMNRWRTVLVLFCSPGDRDRVLGIVRSHLASAGDAELGGSPLLRIAGRTLLLLAATLALFPVRDLVETDVFALILILCFGLAMIWLVPLFGWVVIPAAAYQAVAVARGLLEVRRSTIIPGREYSLYQVLSTADWVLVALAAAGTITLIWLSVRHLRGRTVSVLVDDEAG